MNGYAVLLQAGKLEQKCPRCGLVEAAGAYCTSCLTATGEECAYRPIASEAQLASLRKARVKGGTA